MAIQAALRRYSADSIRRRAPGELQASKSHAVFHTISQYGSAGEARGELFDDI